VNLSAVVLARYAPNKANAMKLIEWLVGEEAQHMYADMNYEYPVRPGIAVNSTIAGYGKLNADTIPLSKIADHKKAAANLVDKVGFDN
jgi:iron(III) transport system substrate-binding protein